MRWPWSKPKTETRAAASGFTAEIMAARESYISGRRGIGELTGTVQTCVSLWENGLTVADVTGTDLLTPQALAIAARSLALRGEAVFLIGDDRLIPAADWDLRTRDGEPAAYRVSISEAGGGTQRTALAAEVLHFRIGADPATPYYGQAPLRRASITAGLLDALESSLRDAFETGSLGSKVLPFPFPDAEDLTRLHARFERQRGKVVLRKAIDVTGVGGPNTDWRPVNLSPDLSVSMTGETLAAARDAICGAFGVLPALMSPATTGPLVREAQRHLASWALQPMAELMAAEASRKLAADVTLDVMRPLQAFDAGGRARAAAGIIEAISLGKQSGLSGEEIAAAFRLVDWQTE
ncbi:MAG: phage portal protein [Pseudomonadota bacterium]